MSHCLLPMSGFIFFSESATFNFSFFVPKLIAPSLLAVDKILLLISNSHSPEPVRMSKEVRRKEEKKKSFIFKISAARLVLLVRFIEALSNVTIIGSSTTFKQISVNFFNINKNLMKNVEFVVLLPIRAIQSPLNTKAKIIAALPCHLSLIMRSLRPAWSHE